MAGSNIRYRLFKTAWADRLERWRLQRLLRLVTNAIVISASVQIGMLPLMIIYFHRISLAALPAQHLYRWIDGDPGIGRDGGRIDFDPGRYAGCAAESAYRED